MSCIDVFEKYYSFAKLPTDNKFYNLKKENYELVKKLYTENATELPTYPLRATIQTTDFCNLNCIMCQIHSQRDKHKLQSMKKADFDLFADKLFPCLVEVHPSNIGEPMISEWFDYLCDTAIEYGVLLDITSNGTLLTEKKIHKILPNLLDIKISFDGVQKYTFERIRKNADYDVVVRNIDNLLRLRETEKSKGTVTLQMTVFNFNFRELPDLICFAKDKGVDRVKAYHVHSYSDDINKYSLFNDLQQFEEVRLQAIELAEQLDIELELSEPEVENNATMDLIAQKCRLLWAEWFIDSDGAVYPCHTHSYIPLGNIFQDTPKEVWNSEYAIKLRKTPTDNAVCNDVICRNCGMNYLKHDENQPVPYNKSDFLFNTSAENEPVKWNKRNKQFLINR